MRHGVKTKKLNRHPKDRQRLMVQLLRAIIINRKITTTQAKAQAVRPMIEKLITMARVAPTQPQIDAAPEGDERDRLRHARAAVFRRGLMELAGSKPVVRQLLEVAPAYIDRPGYVRLIKLGPRKGDAAEMVLLELV